MNISQKTELHRKLREDRKPDLEELYDEVAKDWLHDAPQVRDDLIGWPLLIEKVRDIGVRGLLLDLGCGTGNICRLMSRYAQTVVGMDSSAGMLREAEEHSVGGNIVYVRGDMRNLQSVVAPETVDIVLSIFAYNCLETEDELKKVLRETYSVLRPGGVLIAQVPHPCEIGWKEKSAWMQDLDSVGSYFEDGSIVRRELRLASGKHVTVGRHHFTIASYLNAIVKANLVVREAIEPRPSVDLLAKYPDLAVESMRPSSLLLVAERTK